MQVGWGIICRHSTWRNFLLGGFSLFCNAHYIRWFQQLGTHISPKQKGTRILWAKPYGCETVSTALHHEWRLASSLWWSLGKFSPQKICLWSTRHPCPWAKNLQKNKPNCRAWFSDAFTIVKTMLDLDTSNRRHVIAMNLNCFLERAASRQETNTSKLEE